MTPSPARSTTRPAARTTVLQRLLARDDKKTSARARSSSAVDTPPVTPATPALSVRLRRGELLAADCPSRGVLEHVTSRWGVLLFVVLQDGVQRFSDLRRKVGGVSEKMLSQTLKALEADGFVHRRAFPTVPPHVEYRLTPLGRKAAKHVEALADWVETALPKVLAARRALAADSERSTRRNLPK